MRRALWVAGAGLAGLVALAAGARGQGRGPDPVRALLDGLRGASPVQCEMALQPLNGWWWSDAPMPDRDPGAWAVASWASRGRVTASSVPALAAGLGDADPCVRRAAARMLGRSRLPSAHGRLVEALRDPDPVQRKLGALGLGFSNDRTVITVLQRHLDDRDPGVRAAVAWAMGAVH